MTKVKERKNVPSVESARTPLVSRPIAPCRNNAMSSIASAPATIPATSARHLQMRIDPTGLGDPDIVPDQPLQAGPLSQCQHRRQAGARHQVRVIEHSSEAMAHSHLTDALLRGRISL